MAHNKGQVSLEMLIVLAAAIAFLGVFMSAASDFSGKALNRSELQTQKAAFNDLAYNLNLVNSLSPGTAFKRKITLIENAAIQVNEKNELSMTFELNNHTTTWKQTIPEGAQLNLKELTKGEHVLIYEKTPTGATLTQLN